MKLTFLGTGAADWEKSPSVTEEIRRMSSAVIDECLLIDVAPSSYCYFKYLGFETSKIKNIILTHSHLDHLSFEDLEEFDNDTEDKITFWCHGPVKNKFADKKYNNIELMALTPFALTNIDGYKVMPLPANHYVEDSEETPLHYVIEKDGKKMFYGCDGAMFLATTWEYLKMQKINCAVLDCTSGDFTDELRIGSHNSIPMVRMIADAMRKSGIVENDSIIIASHLAKSLHIDFDSTECILAKNEILMARDGKTLIM